jgi:hypothetical protein
MTRWVEFVIVTNPLTNSPQPAPIPPHMPQNHKAARAAIGESDIPGALLSYDGVNL